MGQVILDNVFQYHHVCCRKSHCHFVGFQRRDQPPPPKIRKFSRNDDHAIRSSTSGAQEGLLNQPVAELAARPRRNYQEDASAVQSIIDLSAVNTNQMLSFFDSHSFLFIL